MVAWSSVDSLPQMINEDHENEKSQKIISFPPKLKIIISVIIGLIFLAGLIINKFTIILISANLNPKNYTSCQSIKEAKNITDDFSNCVVHSNDWRVGVVIIIISPSLVVIFNNVWRVLLTNIDAPKTKFLLMNMIMEGVQTLALCIVVSIIMPNGNTELADLTVMSGFSFFPAFLNLIREPKAKSCDKKIIKAVDILTVSFIFSSIIYLSSNITDSPYKIPIYALSIMFVSLSWVENYLAEGSLLSGSNKMIREYRKDINKCRSKYAVFAHLMKIGIVIVYSTVYSFMDTGKIMRFEHILHFFRPEEGHCFYYDHVLRSLCIVNIISCLVAYIAAKTAIQIGMQFISFTVPLILATPISMVVLLILCIERQSNPCFFENIIPDFVIWRCYESREYTFLTHNGVIIVIFLCSQFWTARHIFRRNTHILMSQHRMFVQPSFDSITLEQGFIHSRRIDDHVNHSSLKRGVSIYDKKAIVTIHMCATMFRENADEQKQLLISFFRMSKDHLSESLNGKPSYRFDASIFFDNAFDENGDLNEYVLNMIRMVNEASRAVTSVNITDPDKYQTPYGAMLVWSMPGNNLLTVHLKNNKKIRNKKRWSQVMYMYYFLGHQLWSKKKGSIEENQKQAENTFILALDADIDFQPSAVMLLLDRMKKSKVLGAACGRIHPVGSGFMVWLQKFEYAVGHWLQKATEDAFGCVLCSPGCFSLFRASALMSKNVMHRYASHAKNPIEILQFDQGEDRWLCTLLLQAGYRIEYCANSDSYTNAPDNFEEFFKQRKRWSPSTVANIFDLLSTWRQTVKKNQYISFPYMVYQGFLFITSIVGSGAIFMMLIGATELSLGFSGMTSFLLNGIPLVIFCFACFYLQSDVQIKMAGILTALYSILMITVLVGTMMTMYDDGICSVSSIYFLIIVGVFAMAVILHPREMSCGAYGMVYFLFIPSLYMLLTVYSVLNLNDVSWGTRENKKPQENTKKDRRSRLSEALGPYLPEFARPLLQKDDHREYIFNCGRMYTCICCPAQDEDELEDIVDCEEKVEKKTVRIDGEKWKFNAALGYGEEKQLPQDEEEFFHGLIDKYLKPETESNDLEKEKVKKGLLKLRDMAATFYFIINAVFVILISSLESNLQEIQYNVTICKQVQKVEPVQTTIMLVFSIVLALQTIGMICHRLKSLKHILASTSLSNKKDQVFQQFAQEIIVEKAKIQTEYVDSAEDWIPDGGHRTSAPPIPLRTKNLIPISSFELKKNANDKQYIMDSSLDSDGSSVNLERGYL